jgi:hypothetical protein
MAAMVAHGLRYFHRAAPASAPGAQLESGVEFGALF